MAEKKEAAEAVAETETDSETLTAEERAFFESGGEEDLPANAEAQETPSDEKLEETGEDAPKGEDAAKDEEREEKGKYVPHQALHAEREKRKAIEAEVQGLREFRARMEERWKLIEQSQQKTEEKEEAPPDPNEDIFAFSQWQAKQLEKLNAKISEREQHEQTQAQQHQEEQKIWGYWNADAQRYAKENPDFPNAAKWLSEARDKQLQAFGSIDGRFRDAGARNAQIEAELKQIVAAAAHQGMSAAEAVYQIAQSYGYAPGNAEESNEKNEAAEKIERLGKAQSASKTVGQASGRSGGDEITPESLAAMSDAEFSRWIDVPENARRFERMMGG